MAKAAEIRISSLAARAILCLLTFLLPGQALALDEFFETYNAPQALAMGNAWTADAAGHAALFHNPAGLAKAPLKGWEIIPVAIEGTTGMSFIGTAYNARSFLANRLTEAVKADPGRYNYVRGNVMPAVARRGFAFAMLGSYEYAAISDGSTIDIKTSNDLGFTIGGASNFAANMVKFGASLKGIIRNELRGAYAHNQLSTNADAMSAQMKEGFGIGADAGIMITLPVSYLPTLGFVWKDMFNTSFYPSRFLNPSNMGVPDPIMQSFNVAVSVHPAIGRGLRASFSAEFKHIERVDLPLQKRLHFGFQFITRKGLYIWAGANQLFPTFGVGLRVKGGDFELSSYAQDVGQGAVSQDDRRFLFRYTISF